MEASNSIEMAIVGGGRWGKILCSALSRFDRVRRIHLVSRRNARGMLDWLSDNRLSGRVVLHRNLDPVIVNADVVAAFVANLPAEHFATARWLLEHGKHVMVEKPFVPTRAEAQTLIGMAEARHLVLAVGLEYFLASYVHYFRSVVVAHGHPADRAVFTWHDVPREERWGVAKQPDATVHVVTDLLPHVLSILTVVLGRCDARIGEVLSPDGGLAARLALDYGPHPVEVSLSRVASEARRALEIQTVNGHRFVLDFTREPGTITVDGRRLPPDHLWESVLRPLPSEIACFLDEIDRDVGALPLLAKETLHIVEATEAAGLKAREKQAELLRQELIGEYPLAPAPAAITALREHLSRPLLEAGFIASPKDEEALARWTRLALRIMHRLACHPFATQSEFGRELGLPRNELKRLNSVLRASDFVQDLIVRHGQAAKYWHNTIIPLVQSGSVQAALSGTYRYPFRIGLYPGVSCMFSCTFCGRNPVAHYDPRSVPAGNEVLQAIFRSAPRDDPHTFYLSGGLEPLTNPGLGALASCGASRGFRLSLYTNGYVLTPRLLERQTGLWDLATLRISIYGVDRDTTAAVTGRENAYDQVVRNAKDFLRLRNERCSGLKFGFNFVILPGRADQVLQLAEIIADVNRQGGGRQVDFLTLREDYSARGSAAIDANERVRMVDIFARLEARLREPDLSGLHVDFGYALHAIRRGQTGRSLEMAHHGEMRRRGYPQVSVVVDVLGDVYLYREAGFIGRPGAERYIIGRAGPGRPLERVVSDFIQSGDGIEPHADDTRYFDIFDHVVTRMLNQAEADEAFGIPWEEGPVRDRTPGTTAPPAARVTVAHPTLDLPARANFAAPVGTTPELRP